MVYIPVRSIRKCGKVIIMKLILPFIKFFNYLYKFSSILGRKIIFFIIVLYCNFFNFIKGCCRQYSVSGMFNNKIYKLFIGSYPIIFSIEIIEM